MKGNGCLDTGQLAENRSSAAADGSRWPAVCHQPLLQLLRLLCAAAPAFMPEQDDQRAMCHSSFGVPALRPSVQQKRSFTMTVPPIHWGMRRHYA